MLFHPKIQTPCEVLGFRRVDPVPVCHCPEDDDLNIMRQRSADVTGTYVFDVNQFPTRKQFKDAVLLAQQQLMQEIEKQNFNMLITEGWVITLHRRAKSYHIQVQYSGRPAYASHVPPHRPPPYLIVLDKEDLTL